MTDLSTSDTASTNGANAPAAVVAAAVGDPASKLNLPSFEHPIVFNKEEKFTFRAPRDAEGKPLLDEIGNPVPKRNPVTVNLPAPTLEGIIVALQDEKQRQILLDAAYDVVVAAAKEQINAVDSEGNFTFKSEADLDYSKLTLEYISNLTKSERKGGGISKETWDDFVKDYCSVMPGITNKPEAKVAKAAQLFAARLQPVKSSKPLLKALQEQLLIWVNSTTRLEEFAELVQFLTGKLDTFLNQKDEDLMNLI